MGMKAAGGALLFYIFNIFLIYYNLFTLHPSCSSLPALPMVAGERIPHMRNGRRLNRESPGQMRKMVSFPSVESPLLSKVTFELLLLVRVKEIFPTARAAKNTVCGKCC